MVMEIIFLSCRCFCSCAAAASAAYHWLLTGTRSLLGFGSALQTHLKISYYSHEPLLYSTSWGLGMHPATVLRKKVYNSQVITTPRKERFASRLSFRIVWVPAGTR